MGGTREGPRSRETHRLNDPVGEVQGSVQKTHRRLKRWLWGLAFASSALLISLWVFSLFYNWRCSWDHAHGSIGLVIREGEILCIRVRTPSDTDMHWMEPAPGRSFSHNESPWSLNRICSKPLGAFESEDRRAADGIVWVCIRRIWLPLWIPLVLLMFPMAYFGWRGRHERRDNECGVCGYDLTGNVSGVCPECGVPIQHGPGAAAAERLSELEQK